MVLLCEKCKDKNMHAGFCEVNIADFQGLLIDSERYAIGRMTYDVPDVIEMIRKYRKYIFDNTRGVIISDIEWWLEGTHSYGDFSEEWAKLLKELKGIKDDK